MPLQTELSSDVLNAALAGLEAQKQRIDEHIAQVRGMLGIAAAGHARRGRPPLSAAAGSSTPHAAPQPRKRRAFSAETRARMAAAQRKRWAIAKKQH